MNTPQVSVIIPVHERAGLLTETLVSVHQQTLDAIEIVVVDDGSATSLEPLVMRIASVLESAKATTFIRFDQPRGANAARNEGMRHAKGTYIQFLDSDDLLHPEKLRRQVRRLEELQGVDAVICRDPVFHQVPEDAKVYWNVGDPSQDMLSRFMNDDPVWNIGSPLWRRSFLEDADLFWREDVLCWQDWLFHVAALCRGMRFHLESEAGHYVRQHAGSRGTDRARQIDRVRAKVETSLALERELNDRRLWSFQRRSAMVCFYLRKTTELNIWDNRKLLANYVRHALRHARTPAQISLCAQLFAILAFRGLAVRWDKAPFRRCMEAKLDRCTQAVPPFMWERHRIEDPESTHAWVETFHAGLAHVRGGVEACS